MGGLRRQDFVDTDIVDATELRSEGSLVLLTGATVVSTIASTKRVVCSGTLFLSGGIDERLEPGDRVVITGDAAGSYTVAAVVSDTELDVEETIPSSSGGSLEARHPPGAVRVGFDPAGATQTTATNVQQAIKDIDAAVASGGITEAQHRVLRHLIHYMEEGPEASSFKETIGGLFPTEVTWYEDATKAKAIVKKVITRTGTGTNVKPTPIKWKIYDATDGTTVLFTIIDAITYSGIAEATRTRTLTVGDA